MADVSDTGKKLGDVLFITNLAFAILITTLFAVALYRDNKGVKGSGHAFVVAGFVFVCLSVAVNIVDIILYQQKIVSCSRGMSQSPVQYLKNWKKKKAPTSSFSSGDYAAA